MKCPQCGAENEDGSNFCNLCYYQFQQANEYETPPDTPIDTNASPPPGDVFGQTAPGIPEDPFGAPAGDVYGGGTHVAPEQSYAMGPGEGYPDEPPGVQEDPFGAPAGDVYGGGTQDAPAPSYPMGPGEGYPQEPPGAGEDPFGAPAGDVYGGGTHVAPEQSYAMGPGEGYPDEPPGVQEDPFGAPAGDVYGASGAGTPSDPYTAPPGDIYSQWRPAPAQSAGVKYKKNFKRIIINTVVLLVIGGVIAAGIIILIPRIFPDEVRYSSSVSALTFLHPSDWQGVYSHQANRVGSLDLNYFGQFNEVLLTDQISPDNQYLLMSKSITGISKDAFQQRRDEIKRTIRANIYNEMDPNTTDPAIAFQDTHINGNPAFTSSFDYVKAGRKIHMNIAVIQNSNTEYYIYLAGFGDEADTQAVFEKILESVRFRG